MSNSYVNDYINRAISQDSLETPNAAEAGKFWEILQTLYMQHQKGGAAQAKVAWDNIQNQYPDLMQLPWHIVPASSLYDLPAPVYLYGEEIVEGKLHFLYGPSGIGKSFIVLDIALQIAQNHPVLYVASEGFSGYADRVKAWTNYHNRGEGQLHFTDTPIPLVEDDKVTDFIVSIKDWGWYPKLIVIDTLSWCIAGYDENSAKDMSAALANCRRIQTELNTAVLLVHHSGKNGGSERGSSALRGAADIALKVDDADGTLIIINDKAKDSEKLPRRSVRIHPTAAREGRTSCVAVHVENGKDYASDKVTSAQLEILEFLALEVFITSGATSKVIETHVTVKNIFPVLSALKNKGYITHSQKGDPYYISEVGRIAIGKSTA